MKIIIILICILCFQLQFYGQKPIVWIISDGCTNSIKNKVTGKDLSDPDDISAIASYLLMSNHFDTRCITVASNQNFGDYKLHVPSQKVWADTLYGNAYMASLPALNKHIGGYKENIVFRESCIKELGERYNTEKSYSCLNKYKSIKALFNEVNKSDENIYVLCWGVLTEQAILVKHCLSNHREDVLSKIKFISHWTNSSFRVGTEQYPDSVHNCFNDASACSYMKEMALQGNIEFYECGAIGQYGIVEGSPKGHEYYDQFKVSPLGKIFAEGKYVPWLDKVDDSDCATYWVLIGKYGVSLNDIANNGTNPPHVEKSNEAVFRKNAPFMRNELLRRVKITLK